MKFNLVDLTLVELDTRSQLRIADLFYDHSYLCCEQLREFDNADQSKDEFYSS